MAYRDDSIVLREKIDRLELSLAQTTGRAILLEEERDAARGELARLHGDPLALAEARGRAGSRSALFGALRMLGALLFAAGIAPMVIVAIAFLASGETGLGLACAAVPWTALLGVLALKLPGIVRWLEMRAEKKQRARRAAQIEEERRERQARVRVSVDALEDTFDGKDALPEEAQESEVERRRGRG